MITKTAEDFLASVARYSKDNNIPVFAITDRGAYIANSHTQNAAIKNADRYLRRLKPKGVEYSRNGSVADKDIDVDKARDHIRKLVALAQPGQSYFLLTNGASAIRNNNVPHIRKLRMAQERWKRRNNFDPDEDWRGIGITKAGAELMKMAAVFDPVRNILVNTAKKIGPGRIFTQAGHNQYEHEVMRQLGREGYADLSKVNPTFYLGEKGAHKFFGDQELVRHIVKRRFGKDLSKELPGSRNVTPDEFDDYLVHGFSDDMNGLFQGKSFNSKRSKQLFNNGGPLTGDPERSRKFVAEALEKQVYTKEYLDYVKNAKRFNMDYSPAGFREYYRKLGKDAVMHQPGAALKLGLNDLWVQRVPGELDTLVATQPKFIGKDNTNLVKTLHRKDRYRLKDDIEKGRTVDLLDNKWKPYYV